MEFKKWFEDRAKLVDEYLAQIINIKDKPHKKIYEAMNYSLLSGGKRMRPILFMATYELYRDNINDILPFACSLEMIHTYSLIHDDLPTMDNDDYRRGKLSSHKKFDEATAILAGDALLNKAFEISLEAIGKNDHKALEALRIIANSSGTEGMIGGQVIDMAGETKIKSLDDLKYMYSLKTGAIIKSSVIAGATLGGASEDEIKRLKTYAEKLGLAFQIKDDILDVTGTQEKLGKVIGSDTVNNKITYLSFKSINEAREDIESLSSEAIESLDIFADRGKYLIGLVDYLKDRLT